MNHPTTYVCAAIALVVLATPATAAKLPVDYAVDFKAYKKVEAGDSLDFEVYSDETCTTLVHAETLSAGDPGLRQAKVLSQKVKSQSPKPPLEMRLRTTLDLVEPLASAFLRVTGANVVPIGDPCQVQHEVPASGGGGGLVAVDADGDVIGHVLSLYSVIIPLPPGLPFEIPLVHGNLRSNLPNVNNEGQLYYASFDCSGPPLMPPDSFPWDQGGSSNVIVQAGTTVYRRPSTGTFQAYNSISASHSFNAAQCGAAPFVPPGGCCYAQSSSFTLGTPDVLDISHVTPPITIEVP